MRYAFHRLRVPIWFTLVIVLLVFLAPRIPRPRLGLGSTGGMCKDVPEVQWDSLEDRVASNANDPDSTLVEVYTPEFRIVLDLNRLQASSHAEFLALRFEQGSEASSRWSLQAPRVEWNPGTSQIRVREWTELSRFPEVMGGRLPWDDAVYRQAVGVGELEIRINTNRELFGALGFYPCVLVNTTNMQSENLVLSPCK